MSSLVSIVPQRAILAESGEEVSAGEVMLNTLLAVKDGEIIPMDGIVVQGKCEVDEKTLTGESFPVPKEIDSTVWAGTINLSGKPFPSLFQLLCLFRYFTYQLYIHKTYCLHGKFFTTLQIVYMAMSFQWTKRSQK